MITFVIQLFFHFKNYFMFYLSKLILVPLILIFGIFNLNAQSVKEVGIRFGSFNGYDLILKKQKSENKFSRFRISAGRLSFNKQNNVNQYSADINLGFGKENRITISDNISFYHGWEPGIGFGLRGDTELRNLSIRPQLGYILGGMYSINNKLIIGIESVPHLYLNSTIIPSQGGTGSSTQIDAGINFNSNLINLNLAYRFN